MVQFNVVNLNTKFDTTRIT